MPESASCDLQTRSRTLSLDSELRGMTMTGASIAMSSCSTIPRPRATAWDSRAAIALLSSCCDCCTARSLGSGRSASVTLMKPKISCGHVTIRASITHSAHAMQRQGCLVGVYSAKRSSHRGCTLT